MCPFDIDELARCDTDPTGRSRNKNDIAGSDVRFAEHMPSCHVSDRQCGRIREAHVLRYLYKSVGIDCGTLRETAVEEAILFT
jgi:hypothetical protein